MYSSDELKKAGIDAQSENLPSLRKGATGEYVQTLQCLLNELIDAGLAVDGKFGTKTETAVKAFQAKNGLKADGVVGPKTWAVLLPDNSDEEMDTDEPAFEDMITVSRTDLAAYVSALENAVKKIKDLLNEEE